MISLTGAKETFDGNGADKTFAYSYPFLVQSDLIVKTRIVATGVEALYVLDTDYSITATNNDYSSGATITTLSGTALAATLQLIVERKVPTTQSTDYPNASFFPSKATEDALDRLTLLVQQLERRISECLRVPDTDIVPSRLANSVDRIDKYLTFDSTGQPVATITVPGESTPSASNPIITSGAGAPGSAPGKIGDIYIDTSGEIPYIGIDTVASSDFVNVQELISDTTPQLFADLDGNSNAITGVTSVDTTLGYKISTALVLDVDNTLKGTFVGENAGAVVSGANNTAIGRDALEANTTASNNTAVGVDCLTTIITGSACTGVGSGCLQDCTGSNNAAIGFQALTNLTSGTGNVAAGRLSARDLTTGLNNVAIGLNTLLVCVSGSSNVVVGASALLAATTSNNTAIGHGAFINATSGHSNVGLGYQSGSNLVSGDKCLIVGYNGDFPSTTTDNQLNIGNVIWGSGCSGTGATPTGQVGIGINAPGTDIILDLTSTTMAFCPPRMTTTNRDAVGTPSAGMVIYNTSTNVLNFYNGSAWGAV